MRRTRILARALFPLLAWAAVGWAIYPILGPRISASIGEPTETQGAALVSYPLSAVYFALSLALYRSAHPRPRRKTKG